MKFRSSHMSFTHKGEYDGGAAFMAFLGATDQKKIHQLIINALQTQLISVFDASQPITYLDLACGDGKAAAAIVKKLAQSHNSGINYVGFDIDSRFVQSTKTYMQSVGILNPSVNQANLFDDSALPIETQNNALASIGHALYYAGVNGKGISDFTAKLKNILGERSLCILTHNGPNCELANIRTTVAKNVFAQPTGVFASVAQKMNMEVISINTKARLHFPILTVGEQQDITNPDQWHTHKRPEFTKTLELISFVAQQGLPVPSNIEATNIPRLSQEEFESVFEQILNHLTKPRVLYKPFLEIHSCYQITFPKDRNINIAETVIQAVNKVKDQLPTIEHQTQIGIHSNRFDRSQAG